MDKKNNFIVTSDEQTKNLLLKEGFTLLSYSDNRYTFLNNVKMTFDGEKLNKVVFTSKLCI